jgi:hypothetical protein
VSSDKFRQRNYRERKELEIWIDHYLENLSRFITENEPLIYFRELTECIDRYIALNKNKHKEKK